MSKKVAVFVWNYFTNDARVWRECTALQEAGYHVDIIALHDPKQVELAKRESPMPNLHIFRVNSELPWLLTKTAHWFKKSKLATVSMGVVAVLLFFIHPVLLLLFALFVGLLAWRKTRTLLRRCSIFSRMVRQGMTQKYDIYHANDLNTLPQAVLCAKLFRRKPLIYDSHEVQTSRTGYDSRLYGISEKWLLRFTDVCIHENHTRASYIEEKYHFYPKVVHNYADVFQPDPCKKIDLHDLLDIPNEEPILLYQGGVQIGRGLDKLIQAIPLFQRGVVIILGDGRIKEDLQQQAKAMHLEKRIRFLPKVPVADLLYYTQNAYLGFQLLNNVCFNHYSASSNKLFEYIMCQVPVIGADFPEIKKVIQEENIGLTVDSHDPVAIAEAVNQLLSNCALRDELSHNCLQAREKYNWNHEKKLFLEIYEELEDGHD
ncbi:glycosyltransferase [Listeria booriae]|uniref:glycosyltransferase n=1 Tax=Listeria booriae TaxID=1552123 RepID=UPI001625E15A|nr:glycosyltransferase [Listeria booriae]MBC2327796.1 glycosyltransferase family 4 protein [Listeria booriae]